MILLVIFLTFVLMRQIEGNPFRTSERAIPESIQQQPRGEVRARPALVRPVREVREGRLHLRPRAVARSAEPHRERHRRPSTSRRSLELGALAMLFALVVGIPLGCSRGPPGEHDVRLRRDVRRERRASRFRASSSRRCSSTTSRSSGATSSACPRAAGATGSRRSCPTIALGLGPMAYFARLDARDDARDPAAGLHPHRARPRASAGGGSSSCTRCVTRSSPW